ncbi:tetratricopeptide repeat protein [Marinomonas sp. THO17]|uniref:tetratricopeptide repeat protein n=1 Tax=Marinomonas sp. THO17 TaxID=3149048 RepID=UPI00336C0CB9
MLLDQRKSIRLASLLNGNQLRVWLTFICLPLLVACSTIKPEQQSLTIENQAQPLVAQDAKQISALLNAEFKLQREGPNKAFDDFYVLAQQTQDLELIKRLTNIAVASRNKVYIEQSTNLWLAVEPTSEQAYALALQVYTQGNRPSDIAQLIDQAMSHQVSLQFLPVYLDDNVRNSQLITTLERGISQSSPASQQDQYVCLSMAHIKLLSGDYQAAKSLAQALLMDKQADNSQAVYLILAYSEKNLEQLDEAISTLQTASKRFPQSPNILSQLLDFLLLAGRTDAAFKLYQTAEIEHTEGIQVGLNFARSLMELDQAQPAFEVLNALPLQAQAYTNQILYLKALSLAELNRINDAVSTMTQVHGALQDSATNQLALWFYQLGKQDTINEMVLERTHRENIPEQVATISQLHQEKGHPKLAYALLTEAVEAFPESDTLRYQKALIADSLNAWQVTLNELQLLADKHPQNAQYLNALGYTLLTRTKQLDLAMQYIEKAYSLSDQDPAIIDSLGWGMFLKGEYEQSSYYLEKAWSLLQDAEIAAHYGESLWQQKHYEQAIRIWRTALQESPTSPILLDTIKRLSPSLLEKQDTTS